MYLWDDKKSEANKLKHGISFEEARDHVFEKANVLATDVAYDKGEVRHAVIGKFQGKYFTGIFTVKAQGVRIISVRRSRDEEEKQAKKHGL
ncbi:MAG TPA: BrnT family toxin [bacterium]|nr:BrnT family toxin [bacterium]